MNPLKKERDNLFLWLPVIFALGVIFHFSYIFLSYGKPIILLFLAIYCSFYQKFNPNLLSQDQFTAILLSNIILIFLSGFLWAKFYDNQFIKAPIVKSNIYGQVEGEIESIKISKNGNKRIILSNLIISKTRFNKSAKKSQEELEIKTERKILKINKNTKKSHLNILGYTKIDRELNKNHHKHSFKDGILQNTPRKISLIIRGKYNQKDLEIGDLIRSKVLLQPIVKNSKIDSFDFEKYYYFRQIGAMGFVIGNIDILNNKQNEKIYHKYKIKIDNWRYKSANRILNNFENKQNGAILNALLLGIRDFIEEDLMQNIRNSGLAHLLAISGLHLSLAGYIFFVFFRYSLTRSEYLTLRFNIKKLAAIFAILSSFSYLLITGIPIPALRAFFMVLVVFLAIIFDKNSNPLRSLAFAALIIMIINPSSIFEISFQMSFTAILALIAFYNFISNKEDLEPASKGVIKKLYHYFLSISTSSLVAQIALAPLIIYYFNNYAVFGILANLIAIPLTTFIIMPLAFIYLLFFNSILEPIIRYILDIALNNMVLISEFVANMRFSNLSISLISSNSLIIMVLGFLLLSLSQQKIFKYSGLSLIFLGAIIAYKTTLPDIIIDKNRQFIAFYLEDELFFSKKVRKSMRVRSLMQKMSAKEMKIISNLNNKNIKCSYELCKIKIKEKNILALLQRSKIEDVCREDYDILINLSKYRLPKCTDYSKKIINNTDLKKYGSQYLYF
jgi:competence protein ComEC